MLCFFFVLENRGGLGAPRIIGVGEATEFFVFILSIGLINLPLLAT